MTLERGLHIASLLATGGILTIAGSALVNAGPNYKVSELALAFHDYGFLTSTTFIVIGCINIAVAMYESNRS